MEHTFAWSGNPIDVSPNRKLFEIIERRTLWIMFPREPYPLTKHMVHVMKLASIGFGSEKVCRLTFENWLNRYFQEHRTYIYSCRFCIRALSNHSAQLGGTLSFTMSNVSEMVNPYIWLPELPFRALTYFSIFQAHVKTEIWTTNFDTPDPVFQKLIFPKDPLPSTHY